MPAHLRRRHQTGVASPEQGVAVAGDPGVEPVAQEERVDDVEAQQRPRPRVQRRRRIEAKGSQEGKRGVDKRLRKACNQGRAVLTGASRCNKLWVRGGGVNLKPEVEPQQTARPPRDSLGRSYSGMRPGVN